MNRNLFGFSTGALERGDFRVALDWMRGERTRSVELSALRHAELKPLVDALVDLDTGSFEYVSFHAPSTFAPNQEEEVLSLLDRVAERGWNIIVHPDVIHTPSLWRRFGSQLLLENMDRRKATGRTVVELAKLFEQLPDARLCLDVAHARQLDTTLMLLRGLIDSFHDRIAEVHISELDSHCHHRPLTSGSVADYQQFADQLRNVPVIIESILDSEDHELRRQELHWAREAMDDIQDHDGTRRTALVPRRATA